MDKAQFLELTQVGKEGRNLEFKRSTSWDNGDFRLKIVKSSLAFSNVRDGGAIVIGVEEQPNGSFDFTGVQLDYAETYREDQVASFVAEYADPFVKLRIEKPNIDGKVYVVILVEEFDEIPVLCKRDSAGGLRKGAMYTRTRRMAESAEVPSQTELREVLDVAIEKGIRRFYVTAARAGLAFAEARVATDENKFLRELEDLR